MNRQLITTHWQGRQQRWLGLSLGLLILLVGLPPSWLYASVIRNIGALMLIQEPSSARAWLEYSHLFYGAPQTLRLIGTAYQQENKIADAIYTWRQAGMTQYAIETFLVLLPTAPPNRSDWERQIIPLIANTTDWARLGDIFLQLGDAAKAVDAYQQALGEGFNKQKINKADIYYNLGYIYQFQQNDYTKALKAYYAAKQAGGFQDKWHEFNTYLQIASLELGKNDKAALASAQVAVQLKPENELAHTVLGLTIYAATSDLQSAEREMDLAARLNPTSLWPWLHRAQLYIYAHDYKDAIQSYKKVLALDPKYTFAQEMIKYIEQTFLDREVTP